MWATIAKAAPNQITRALKITLMLSLVLMVCAVGNTKASEQLYPIALMNWMVEGSYYALIVDKSQQKLFVWQIKDGEPLLTETFRCSTGENDGDKWVRGDMRTPEGVYFFYSVIDGKTLPPKYGLWAFTTDYPNFVDRRRGKNGDGIWLHGRDKPLAPKPDSNGCVALENDDLIAVSKYIRLQNTPLIVMDKMKMAPKSEIMEQEREVRNFLESWRRSWESKDLDTYMNYYSPNFQSSWLDYRGWKDKKRRLNRKYSSIKVKLGNIYLYRQNGLITSIFNQSYSTDGFESFGVKSLYLVGHGKYAIYAEDYHHAVEESCTVAPLLARHGVGPAPVELETVDQGDYKIRLVSTDEPDPGPAVDSDEEQLTKPIKQASLEKFAAGKAKTAPMNLESNSKFINASSPQRLIISRVAYAIGSASNPSANDQADPHEITVSATNRRTAAILIIPEPPVKVATTKENRKRSEPGALQIATNRSQSTNKFLELQFNKAASEGSSGDNTPVDNKIITEFVHSWKIAWEKKDLDTFMKMYHPKFGQGGLNYKTFRLSKKNFFGKYKSIHIDVDGIEVRNNQNRTEVTFIQSFQGDGYRDKGRKTMVLDIGKDKGVRIISEEWSPLKGNAANSGS